MQIRQATPHDFDTVYECINLLEYETMDRETQHRVFLHNVADPNVVYLLAENESGPLGFMSLHIQNLLHHGGPVGEIQELFVFEHARNTGVGKQLMDRMKQLANSRGVLQMEVTSRFAREAAHRFYEREGFVHTHKKFIFK